MTTRPAHIQIQKILSSDVLSSAHTHTHIKYGVKFILWDATTNRFLTPVSNKFSGHLERSKPKLHWMQPSLTPLPKGDITAEGICLSDEFC